jgi:hypothetical protein
VATRGVFVTSRVSCCQVFPLQGCKLVRISMTLSEMSDSLMLCSNVVVSNIDYMDDIDYFVSQCVGNIKY